MSLVERNEKNVWTVELFTDGSLVVTSFYKRRVNQQHRLRFWMKVDGVPLYVKRMVKKMRESHPEICKVRNLR